MIPSMFPETLLAQILFVTSSLIYFGFWLWGILHALNTPKATGLQRALWGVAMVANPSTAIWYWYIWKRWAFWTLFSPVLIGFLTLPWVVREVLYEADATAITNFLYALGSARLLTLIAILMIFPLILRLTAFLHLAKNTALSAMDRNDWVVSLALPVFGFGAGITYCAKWRKGWAMMGLLWWVVIVIALWAVTQNVSPVLVRAGEDMRRALIK